jgi:two-component system, chemotaxis family, chemotaxis protein CheY
MNFSGKILLVDDEAHVRKFVSLILRTALGPETVVIEAEDGETAVETYRSQRPDLVLLDVNMPRLDGLGALRAIREIDPEAAAIMLTSLANRQTVEEARELGAVHYLRKDTPREEIAATLRQLVAELFPA